MEKNQAQILSDAPIFGLSWLSDGATIARMPLINTLAMCSNVTPTCVTITDCSGHICEGGKKDASFIAALMQDTILKYDPQKLYTDVFYFDGEVIWLNQDVSRRQSFQGHMHYMEGNMLCLCFLMICQNTKL
jgi:hypothetical protein